ncbi:MAG: transcriptional repressor [Nitrospinae bacterium]|jgi:Fur family transcriptional regulator, ferric uptake regulator|nr:transcriptional repressor [Nitrospinota bacterium]MDA1110823.1 transcriptional repressor [Nitrospinota bacterium]
MFNEFEILRGYLRESDLRFTPQRQTILEVFLESEGHVEADDLFLEIQKIDSSIGIATVYRTLNLFVECGLARQNVLGRGQKSFEKLYRQGHHDHLICLQCRNIVEFEHPLIEKYQLEICQSHGFTLNQHRMEIYGYCSSCQKNRRED